MKEQRVTIIRCKRTSPESTNVNFVEADDEEHDRSTCSTLFGKQRSGQDLVDVAFINPDGNGQNEHSRHQTRGE